jgi:hypothetical protein
MVLKRELFLLGLVFTGCGSDEDATPEATAIDAGGDRVSAHPDVELVDATPPADASVDVPVAIPDAACNVVVETPPVEPAMHVPEGTVITYSTNPPSSGSHYPIWANFREYANPVADGYLVHSMEHGAVVIFYDCDPSACVAPPGVLDALRAVRNAVPTDPSCDPSIRVRVILAPRPANDVPIAAAAWGATYKAQCVDAPSLSKFITDFYAKGPENFCTPGMEF